MRAAVIIDDGRACVSGNLAVKLAHASDTVAALPMYALAKTVGHQTHKMIMGENEIWCLAWRLLVKHQERTDEIIALEIEKCRIAGDRNGAMYWQKVANALDDFR